MNRFFYKRPASWDYVMILVGTGLLAFSIQCVFDPNGMVIGGFTGIAIVVKEITRNMIPGGMPLWLTNVFLNIPVFILACRIKGRRFVWRTIVGTAMLSGWLYVIPPMDLSQSDYILAALFGGFLSGISMGLILLAKATTGGTDMVATLIQHRLKHYSVVQIMQILDGLIVLSGLYVFGMRAALYAIVAIAVTTKVTDMLMEGMKYSKAALIVSDRYEIVAKRIMEEMERGVSGLYARGMYSGMDKCILYCVVSRKEIVRVKEIVAEVDPAAFVILSDVREVLGEGFIEYTK